MCVKIYKLSCFLYLFFSQLAKLTVAVLKEFVKKAGIRSGTKKAELIAAINEHFSV